MSSEISLSLDHIQFCVLRNKDIKNISVIKDQYGINKAELMYDSAPARGGLLDPRLGTTDHNLDCATCGLSQEYCPGHFGHTDLAEPIFHLGFIDKIPIVKYILDCICIRCSKLLVYKTEEELLELLKHKTGKNRFMEIRKLTGNISYCARPDLNCGAPVPKIKKEIKKTSGTIQLVLIGELDLGDMVTENVEDKKKMKQVLTPKMVYNIFKNISDSDFRIMGFNPSITRPEDLIIKTFPIPPIAIRPSVKMGFLSSASYEDTLTGKLVDIIKANSRIRKQMDKESDEVIKYLVDHHQLLQYHHATYFDNESVNLPKSEQKTGGRPSKSISERIRGKAGRIRCNLMGKRTDFCARTVITSDPNLSLDELGVPIKIAMNITFPELVTPYKDRKSVV